MKKYFNNVGFILVFFSVIACSSPVKKIKVTNTNNTKWDQTELILKNIVPPVFPEREFLITDYGAKGDGKTNSLPAFIKAINLCNMQGGGTIIVPPGVYFVEGPIHLKSNINLHLEEGSKIIFTSVTDNYLPVVLTKWEGTELFNYSPLIYAYQCTNIAITGKGIINGNAKNGFATWKPNEDEAKWKLRQMGNDGVPINERVFGKGHFLRPSMIQFYGCKNILIDGITINDSPFWVIHPVFSNNITVRNVIIDSWNKNNDGFDPDACTNVLMYYTDIG